MEYNEIKKTNKVLLKGKIIDTLEIAYECFGENFLKTKLSCKRSSGTEDILPVIFPERMKAFSQALVSRLMERLGLAINMTLTRINYLLMFIVTNLISFKRKSFIRQMISS